MKKVFLLLYLLSEVGVGYYFGKNKIQYNPSDWTIHKTRHFNIHVQKDQPELAQYAATILENWTDTLSTLYQSRLEESIPIILYSSTHEFLNNNILDNFLSESVGGFTEMTYNRVVLPFNGDKATFYHTLVHELNHVYQFHCMRQGREGGFLKGLSRSREIPLWFLEGLAEYVTLGLDANTEQYLRDGIIRNVLPTLEELNRPYFLGKRYYYVYKGAQGFFYWLETVYGTQTLHHFIKSVFSHGQKVAFQEVLGLSEREISEKWHLFLKEKYWKDIPKKASDPFSHEDEKTLHRPPRPQTTQSRFPSQSALRERRSIFILHRHKPILFTNSSILHRREKSSPCHCVGRTTTPIRKHQSVTQYPIVRSGENTSSFHVSVGEEVLF